MLNAADFGTTKINGSWSCEPDSQARKGHVVTWQPPLQTAHTHMGTHEHTVSLHKTIKNILIYSDLKGCGDFVATVRTKCDFKFEYDVTHGSFRYSQSNAQQSMSCVREKGLVKVHMELRRS